MATKMFIFATLYWVFYCPLTSNVYSTVERSKHHFHICDFKVKSVYPFTHSPTFNLHQ